MEESVEVGIGAGFCTNGFDCIRDITSLNMASGFIDPDVALLSGYFFDDLMVVGDVYRQEYVVLVKSPQHYEFGDINGRTVCIPASGEFPLSRRIIRRFEEIITGERKNTYIEHVKSLNRYFRESCKAGSWLLDPILDNKMKRKYSKLLEFCDLTQKDEDAVVSALKCFNNGGDVVLTTIEAIEKIGLKDPIYLRLDGRSSNKPHIWFSTPKEVIIARNSSAASTQTYLQNYMKNDINSPIKLLNRSQTLSAYTKSLNLSLDFVPGHKSIRWCTVSKKEQNKCLWLSRASYIEYTDVDIKCIQKPNIDDCLASINRGEVDLVVCRKPHTRANANVTVINVKEEDMTKILVVVDITEYSVSTGLNEKRGCVSKLANPDLISSFDVRDNNAETLKCLDLPDKEFAVIAINGTNTPSGKESLTVLCKDHTFNINKVFGAVNCNCAFCTPRGSNLFIANDRLEDTKKLLLDLNVLFGQDSNHPFKLFGTFFNDSNLLFENTTTTLYFPHEWYDYSGDFHILLSSSTLVNSRTSILVGATLRAFNLFLLALCCILSCVKCIIHLQKKYIGGIDEELPLYYDQEAKSPYY